MTKAKRKLYTISEMRQRGMSYMDRTKEIQRIKKEQIEKSRIKPLELKRDLTTSLKVSDDLPEIEKANKKSNKNRVLISSILIFIAVIIWLIVV